MVPNRLRASLIGLLAWLGATIPATAYVINLDGTYVPDAGQVEVSAYRFYAPFSAQLDGRLRSPIAESYHWGEAWNAVEVGLGGGYSAMLVYAFDRQRALGGGDEQAGMAGLTFHVNRQLWQAGPYEGRLRFRSDLGPAPGMRLSRLGLQHSQSLRLGDRWRLYANFNYLWPLAYGTGPAGQLARPGHQFQLNTAAEFHVNDHLSLIVEQLGAWQGRGSEAGAIDPTSGASVVHLAPGVTWVLTPQFALQASVALPVYWYGFGDAYPWMSSVGTVIDF